VDAFFRRNEPGSARGGQHVVVERVSAKGTDERAGVRGEDAGGSGQNAVSATRGPWRSGMERARRSSARVDPVCWSGSPGQPRASEIRDSSGWTIDFADGPFRRRVIPGALSNQGVEA